jgi:hypothetical protein
MDKDNHKIKFGDKVEFVANPGNYGIVVCGFCAETMNYVAHFLSGEREIGLFYNVELRYVLEAK